MSRRVGTRGRIVAAVVVALFVWPLAGAVSNAETTSALRVETAGPPQWVHGSDGRDHIEYDLVVTNAFGADATLDSLEVRGHGTKLLSLTGGKLSASTLRLFTGKPTGRVVAASSGVLIFVDVALRRSAGRVVPAELENRIVYSLPADAPNRSLVGTRIVQMPPLRVDRTAPVVIASPLRGTGWLNANGCCDAPTANHRYALFGTSSGRYVAPEIFAIDWMRVANGLLWTGNGEKNSEWRGYGAPLYAVADGTVVRVVDNKRDIAPDTNNSSLVLPADYGGNQVFLKIGPNRYACYAHLQPGSVLVHRGQHVRVGQRIGLLGNSGNTTGPHLHFGIQRQPDCLSQSEPFEIDRFRLQGQAVPNTEAPKVKIVGTARRERGVLPLFFAVASF